MGFQPMVFSPRGQDARGTCFQPVDFPQGQDARDTCFQPMVFSPRGQDARDTCFQPVVLSPRGQDALGTCYQPKVLPLFPLPKGVRACEKPKCELNRGAAVTAQESKDAFRHKDLRSLGRSHRLQPQQNHSFQDLGGLEGFY